MPKSASKVVCFKGGAMTSTRRDKYKGYVIRQGKKEKNFQFVRRIVENVILVVNSSITIYNLVKDLEDLTDMGVDRGFLLNTITYRRSGIVIDGDIVYASDDERKLAENILRAGEMEVYLAGGEIDADELFACVRKKSTQFISEKILHTSLKNRGNLKWKTRGGKTMVFLKG